MSTTSVPVTIDRIMLATPSSPIAVFRSHVHLQLETRFANTIVTQRVIRRGHPDLVGVFSREDADLDLRELLKTEARKAPAERVSAGEGT